MAAIKRAVNAAGFHTPVVASGGITTFEQAEKILERGEADLAGFARQALADPDWFLKVRLGRGTEVRRCTYTNYCEALDQAHKQVTLSCGIAPSSMSRMSVWRPTADGACCRQNGKCRASLRGYPTSRLNTVYGK